MVFYNVLVICERSQNIDICIKNDNQSEGGNKEI